MPADVTADDCRVDEDIRIAETLPAAAFTDHAFLARELATVFTESWQLVPSATADDPRPLDEQASARGARVPVSLLGRPLYLQRGWDDDTLRLFPNTCTHSWFPLVLGATRGPTLVCAQHGRKFDCEGRFISQTGFGKDVPDFPRACDHLPSLGVAAWRNMVFARLTEKGPDFASLMAPVEETLAKIPAVDLAAPGVRAGAEVRDIAGNWKHHAWNYLDRFHIAFVHRAPGGLADAIDLASYRTEIHDDSVLQWVYAADPADGFDPSWLPARFADPNGRRVFALWWFIYPNLTLNIYPWGISVNCYQPRPDRPDATRFYWYQWPIDREKFAQRDRRWLSAQVDAEDVDALAQVSRGVRSGFAPRGRFAPREEQAAHWLHRKVSASVWP